MADALSRPLCYAAPIRDGARSHASPGWSYRLVSVVYLLVILLFGLRVWIYFVIFATKSRIYFPARRAVPVAPCRMRLGAMPCNGKRARTGGRPWRWGAGPRRLGSCREAPSP